MDEETRTGALRTRLVEFAKRCVSIKPACTNEESTKFYLVMPFLGFLGYDYSNPYEVYPEHVADFAANALNKVDLAILRGGAPIIAVECKKVGAELSDSRGQLRGYFNALVSTKLGILTNGMIYEFFVDSEQPNIMDDEPFLTLDLESAGRVDVADEVLEALECVTKPNFDPETITDAAYLQLTKKRLRTMLVEEVSNPSEEFCRFALQRVGLKNVRKAAIDRYYGPMIKSALDESLLLPAVNRLRAEVGTDLKRDSKPDEKIEQRAITTDRELAIYSYVRRRLAFLVDEETHFAAIERVYYKDYVGKLKIFYCREQKGHLFDYIEAADGYDKFIFPDPIGAVVTNNLFEIDGPLKATFVARVRLLTEDRLVQRLPRIA